MSSRPSDFVPIPARLREIFTLIYGPRPDWYYDDYDAGAEETDISFQDFQELVDEHDIETEGTNCWHSWLKEIRNGNMSGIERIHYTSEPVVRIVGKTYLTACGIHRVVNSDNDYTATFDERVGRLYSFDPERVTCPDCLRWLALFGKEPRPPWAKKD